MTADHGVRDHLGGDQLIVDVGLPRHLVLSRGFRVGVEVESGSTGVEPEEIARP